MLSKLFASACLAGAALTLDLNGSSNGNNKIDANVNLNIDMRSDNDVDVDVNAEASSETEWQDSNICITYGADNSSTGCGSGCGSRCGSCSSCQTTVSCDEVTYTSAAFDVEGISGISTGTAGSTDDVTVSAETSYEILGYGDRATLRSKIVIEMSNDSTWATDEKAEAFFVYVDDDNILNGYVATYSQNSDNFKWQRFTQATTTIPTLTIATALVDLATAGLTEVLSETFDDGDSSKTVTVSTGAETAYRLQVDGTSVVTDTTDTVTFTAVKEGDNDLLAIIAGGRAYDNVTFGVVQDEDGTINGDSVTDARIVFGAQLGDKYDDPCFCCTPVGCGC